MSDSPKIFTKSFWLMFVANFIVVAVYFLLMTTMAAYALGAFTGCTDSQAGLAASIFLIGGVLGRVVCGHYSETLGLRLETIISVVVMLVSCVAYHFCTSLVPLLVFRLIHGIAFGVGNTTIPAIVSRTLPKDRIGEGTGYFMLSQSLAVGIGPMIGIFVSHGFNYQVVFVVCGVLTAVALACSLIIKIPGDAGTMKRPGAFHISSFMDRKAAVFGLFMFLVAFGYASINTYMSSYANSMGLGLYAPFTFLMYSVALLISRPFTGKLMDKRGENAVLPLSIVCHGIALVLASQAHNGIMVVCVGIFMALGFGTCMSVGQAVTVKIVGQQRSTVGISTFFLLTDAGCGIAPYFWGMVISHGSYSAMYLCCAAVALLALVYYYLVHGRKVRKK